MIKTTTYIGDGICSLCGANKPTQQIQYTSATRKASVPICDKCYAQIKPCESCKPKKKKKTKLEEFGDMMVGEADLPKVVPIPDAEVSKEIEEMHDELLTIAEEYND